MANEYTAERLMRLGSDCNRDNRGASGLEIVRYAEAWEKERDELARDWDVEHYHRLAIERDRDELWAENERLRHDIERYVNAAADEASAIAQEAGQYGGWPEDHGNYIGVPVADDPDRQE